jgi:hypothetical protein
LVRIKQSGFNRFGYKARSHGDGTDAIGQFTTELDRVTEIHDSQGQFSVFGAFLAEKYIIPVYSVLCLSGAVE